MLVQAALPHLGEGSITAFISSDIVGQPYHGLTHYASSKAALEEVVRGLRFEHPEHRFSCIRVGPTFGTDFARDFDPDIAGDLLPKWMALGRLPAQMMDAAEVGRAIADTLALAYTTPTVEFQDLILRPPGGPQLSGSETLLAQLEEQRQAVDP